MATVFTLYAGLNSSNVYPNAFDINRSILFGILGRNHSDGFTAFEGYGYFQGVSEPVVVVTIIANGDDEARAAHEAVSLTAKEYKEEANQIEVWITVREEGLIIV